MSQHDYNIANAGGAAVRADINNLAGAILSQNSGASEPSTKLAYMLWADTTNGLMKQRDSANATWITMWTLGQGAGAFQSGTRLLFRGTIPTGWTIDTTAGYDNAALRIVTGAQGSGGSDAFNTVFGSGKSTASYTLQVADIPSHNHGGSTSTDGSHTHGIKTATLSGGTPRDQGLNSGGTVTFNTESGGSHQHTIPAQGGGGGHSHGLTMNIKYVDLNIASKD